MKREKYGSKPPWDMAAKSDKKRKTKKKEKITGLEALHDNGMQKMRM